jgi:hypothetical protein
MSNTNKAELNADVVQWLNKKTKSSNHRIVILDGFTFMLSKIKLQGSVRLAKDDCFHQRFWKSLDRTLNYGLLRNKRKMPIALYKFYYGISLSEGFIYFEDGLAKITEKGLDFLKLPYEEQLSFILSKIW